MLSTSSSSIYPLPGFPASSGFAVASALDALGPNSNSPPHASKADNCPNATCKEHHPKRPGIVSGLASTAGLIGTGLLLHQLPPRLPKDGLKTMLPADWKVWARVILGIAAIQKLNQTFNWKPAPWLGALQAVALINPIAVGFSVNNLIQMAVMAPIVAGVVQGASVLQRKLAPPAKDRLDAPPILVRFGISLALGIGSLLAYPVIYRRIAASGLIGKELQEKALDSGSAFASATFATCARGCSPGSFICLGEMADIVGSLGNWTDPKIISSGKGTDDSAASSQGPSKKPETSFI
jgi:hypothetical protein